MKNKLPQQEENAANREKRRVSLERMQAIYEYSYEYADTIAVLRKLSWREIPGFWFLYRLVMNLLQLIPSLPSLAIKFLRYLSGLSLRNYLDYIFYPFSPPPNPAVADNFQDDLIFGLQRVIGVNPVALRAVTRRQPLSEKLPKKEIQRIFAEQVDEMDYSAAVEQKRLYVLDYAVLQILQQNPGSIDGGRKQYITTPIVVLFQQANGMLRPIAIQLYQDDRPDNPVYAPKDGNLWLAAKTFAQIADGNHHILYTHATRIHYVMEAIIMASYRQLYRSHPLYVLLHPHLQHTLFVNHQHTFLKDRKGRPGRFGELFAGDYDATTRCMAEGMTSFNFADTAFPNNIASREVDNPELFYPFRDDGILLWNVIQAFAKDYVDLYYRSDKDVSEDHELQAWANDVTAQDRGRIPGFPSGFSSKQELASTLGHFIFLCTAYHSCIHFNQYEYAGFVPNMPYAAYIPPPNGKDTPWNEADLFNIQPRFRAALSQTWTFFQTNFRVNRIGEYDLSRFDPEAQPIIERFKSQLEHTERQIDQANANRPVPYKRLKPSEIPNGVTI